MTDFPHLLGAATKAERAASRRLAERAGLSAEQALRTTLEQVAGTLGLAHLLAQRGALRAHADQRAAARAAVSALALARRQARHDGTATPWRAWFDGSAHPNPGQCGIGALLKGPAGELVEISRDAGYGNSGEAEYRALIALLEAALRSSAHGLTVYGDSQVVVNDVNGPEGACAASLRSYRTAALALIAQLRDVTVRWIPRHKNAAADALSQRAVRLQREKPDRIDDTA